VTETDHQRRDNVADLCDNRSVRAIPPARSWRGLLGHEETFLYADVELAAVRAASRLFDPLGHYSRPDIFQLRVNTRSRPAVVLDHPSDNQTPVEPTAKPALRTRDEG
jgi:hypothetical protein